MTDKFSRQLLNWYDQFGRKSLPWQIETSAYKTWVSEIMLQQTQVDTVIPYFLRFLNRFPTVESLAHAELDEVLHLWTGLGYYARARNLHKAAVKIRNEFGGVFPQKFENICQLPGIGRSTAGAIASLAMGQRYAILDGNVKRVLSRYFKIDGWYGQSVVQKRLWVLAEQLLPNERFAEYSQAIMDLGAMVCKRSRPDCDVCPVSQDCLAYRDNVQHLYPAARPKKTKPVKQCAMVLFVAKEQFVWIRQRPVSGLWGGLWEGIEMPYLNVVSKAWLDSLSGDVGFDVHAQQCRLLEGFRHTFTHFYLDIQPVIVGLEDKCLSFVHGVWYDLKSPPEVGLSAPIKRVFSLL